MSRTRDLVTVLDVLRGYSSGGNNCRGTLCGGQATGNTKSPGSIFAKTFSKNLSYVEDKSRDLGKDSLTAESDELPKSALPLDRKKIRYFQLLSELKEERRRCFKEIAKLLQDKENYIAKYNELTQEREGNLKRISLLEGEKENLLGSLAEIKCEQDKYRALVSELQECKSSCYQTISDLQEEKCVLKGAIDQIKKENAERLGEFQKANADFILENNKLKELMYSLGFTYEDLRKENSLGIKEKVVKIKEENKSQQYGAKPMTVETACSVTQTEEEGRDPSIYFHRKEVNIKNNECYQAGSSKERRKYEHVHLLTFILIGFIFFSCSGFCEMYT